MRTISFFIFCFTIASVCTILSLWQISRLQEKQTLLDSIQTNLKKSPVKLNPKKPPENWSVVKATGYFTDKLNERFYLQPRSHNNQKQHRILRILHVNENPIIIDLGWLPSNSPMLAHKTTISGFIRTPMKTSLFTPHNNLEKNQWYYINTNEIAQYTNLPVQNFYISQNKKLAQNIPNNHTQYSITWISLALIFFIMPFLTRKKW